MSPGRPRKKRDAGDKEAQSVTQWKEGRQKGVGADTLALYKIG